MCVDFPDIQSRLFLSLDELLGCKADESGWKDIFGDRLMDDVPWENELGRLIAEIFDNNTELCSHIKDRQVSY